MMTTPCGSPRPTSARHIALNTICTRHWAQRREHCVRPIGSALTVSRRQMSHSISPRPGPQGKHRNGPERAFFSLETLCRG